MLTGGRRRPDLGPTLLRADRADRRDAEMACFAEETFGPVVSVYPVADDDEASHGPTTRRTASMPASGPPIPRAAAGWPAQIECGTVNVNEGFAATFGSIDAPMGGMKQSGLGRRQGREGIRRFVEIQSVATQSACRSRPASGCPRRPSSPPCPA